MVPTRLGLHSSACRDIHIDSSICTQLEAAIIDGASGAYGAVACLEKTKNPIDGAAAVLKAGRHAFIVGSAADDFARDSGLPMVSNDYFTTEDALLHWRERSNTLSMSGVDLETVGAVALDTYGHLAAAGSTGGLTGKMKGRIGDTAIIGAGIYADDKIAVVWWVAAWFLVEL